MQEVERGLLIVGAALAAIWLLRKREAARQAAPSAALPGGGQVWQAVYPTAAPVQQPQVWTVVYPTPTVTPAPQQEPRVSITLPIGDWVESRPGVGEITLPGTVTVGVPMYYDKIKIPERLEVVELLTSIARPITVPEQPSMTAIRG